MDDGSPVELCMYCCKFLFQIHRFRSRCENVQKKLQVHFKAKQNKHKNVETMAQTDTKIQTPEKPNESIIPVIKEENSTDDSEVACLAPTVAKSDENTWTSADVKSEILEDDYDSEMPAVKTETISKADENTMTDIKEEVITDDYENVVPPPKRIALSNNSKSAEPNEPVNFRFVSNRVKVNDCNDEKHKFGSKNNSPSDALQNNLSALYESRYDEEIRNWQCEYFVEAEEMRTCKLCNRKFIHFEKHISSCPKYKVVCCKYCTLYFRSTTDLVQHMKQVHGGWILCTICSKSFLGYNTLLDHTRTHSTLECLMCNLEFKSPESITNHNATLHARIINEKCPICKYNCATEFELNNHIKTAHDDNLHPCEHCGNVYRHFFEKVAHATLHNIHQCDLCGETFRHELCLNVHKRWHGPNMMELSCEICKCEFITITAYKIHMQNHAFQTKVKHCDDRRDSPTPNKSPENICPRCNEKFNDLKRHLEICHAPIMRLFDPKTEKVYRNLEQIIESKDAQCSFGSKLEGNPIKKSESANLKIRPVESRNDSSTDATVKVYVNKRLSKKSP